MEFLWPSMLWLLLLVPVLILAYIWAQRRRQKYALRFANLSLVKQAMGRGPGIRRHIPPALFLIGMSAMIVGMARPMMTIKTPSQEGTIILVIDTSGSMAADDVHPTRMEAAKAAARTFVENQPKSVKIGVVSFSDDAFVVQAPTTDQPAVLTAIDRLYPQRGTAIGSGMEAALRALLESQGIVADTSASQFSQFNDPLQSAAPTPTPLPRGVFTSGVVVLLTDGENNLGPDPADVASTLADRGIRVYSIGLGSPQGSILHIAGRSIHVGLDEATLKAIAQTTGGAYYNAVTEGDLKTVYENLGTRLVFKDEKTEFTAGFTGIAALFTLIGGIFSLFWFNRLP
jgi:Ca-activated chloride channel family protein